MAEPIVIKPTKADADPEDGLDFSRDTEDETTEEIRIRQEQSKRIRWVCWVAFLVVILCTALWYSWYQMSVDSHRLPAKQLLEAVMSRTVVIVNETLQPGDLALDTIVQDAQTGEIVNLYKNATGLAAGVITSEIVKNPCDHIRFLHQLMKLHAGLSFGLGTAFEDGAEFYVAHEKTAAGADLFTIFVSDIQDSLNLGCGTDSCAYNFNASGCVDRSGLIRNWGAYDPRTRPWFVQAKAKRRKGYTAPYPDLNFRSLVVSEFAPIYAEDKSTILGVALFDVKLDIISSKTSAITKEGVSFITETVKTGTTEQDFLVAASAGTTAVPTRVVPRPTDPRRLVADSEIEEVRRAHKFLTDKYADGGTMNKLPNRTILETGSILAREPLVGTIHFIDSTGDLDWRVVVTYNEEHFLLYILVDMIVTAVAGAVILWALTVGIVRTIQERPLPRITLPSICLCICLWVAWLVTTKDATTKIIDDALEEHARLLAEYTTWTWEDYFDTMAVSTISYHIGFLPMEASDASTNTRVQTHFANAVTQMISHSVFVTAVYAGFENGDLSGMTWECTNQGTTCLLGGMLRSVTNTSGRLQITNVVPDATGTSWVRGDVTTASSGSYDATTRPWYKDGKRVGRAGTSRTGNFAISQLYTDATSGALTITFVQPFYSSSLELKGVLAVDLVVDGQSPVGSINYFLNNQSVFKSSEMLVTQDRGDVVYAPKAKNFRIDSGNLFARLLAMDTELKQARAWAVELWDQYTSFVVAQNQTSLAGKTIKVSSSLGVLDTRYSVLFAMLTNWTLLSVSPRSVYYQEYDDAAATSFGFIVFGFTLIVFEMSRLTDVLKPTTDKAKADREPSTPRVPQDELIEQLLRQSQVEQAADDTHEHERLLITLRTLLLPFVEGVCEDNPERDLHQVLLDKIRFYHRSVFQSQNEWDSRPIIACMVLEGRHGSSNWLFRLTLSTLTRTAHYITRFCLWVFMLCELITNTRVRMGIDIVCLSFLTMMYLIRTYSIRNTIGLHGHVYGPSTVAHAIMWPLVFVDWFTSLPLLGFVRPALFFMHSAQLRQNTKLVLQCVWRIRTSIVMFFAVVCIFALMGFTLYRGKFKAEQGDTLDDFLEAFLRLFVLLESGENYTDLAHQGARQSEYNWIFFVMLSIVGVFFFLSMVLALFGSTWDDLQDSIQEENIARRRPVVAIYYTLSIWNQPPTNRMPHADSLMAQLGWHSGQLVMSTDRFIDYVNVFHPMSQEAALFVLKLVDEDENGTAELAEVDDALFLGDCFVKMQADRLISHKVVVARYVLLVQERERWLEALPLGDEHEEDRAAIGKKLKKTQVALKAAESELQGHYQGIVRNMMIFNTFTMQDLDEASIVVLILFCLLTTLKIQDNFDTADKVAGFCFNVLFCVEVGIRFNVMGNKQFWHDPRGDEYTLQNKVAFVTSLIGIVAAFITVSTSGGARFTEMIQLAPLWRVLVMHTGFRELMSSFTMGLQAIKGICLFLFAVFFFFCQVAFVAFKHNTVISDVTSFETLFDTYMTMYQVGIGTGWHEVMDNAVDQTYEVYNFFFLLYVVLVGVLFTNLVVGILVNVFQAHTKGQATILGEMKNIFPRLEHLPLKRQEELQKEMGVVAKELLKQDENRQSSFRDSHVSGLNLTLNSNEAAVEDKEKQLAQIETQLAKLARLQKAKAELVCELETLRLSSPRSPRPKPSAPDTINPLTPFRDEAGKDVTKQPEEAAKSPPCVDVEIQELEAMSTSTDDDLKPAVGIEIKELDALESNSTPQDPSPDPDAKGDSPVGVPIQEQV